MSMPDDAAGTPVCPKCDRPAPRLITWHPAHLSTPAVECPRCAYPTTRYLGTLLETMPDDDLAWYDAHPTTTDATASDVSHAAAAHAHDLGGMAAA